MPTHQDYMKRCFDLARLGAGKTSPNPMVGAVLVHEGRIIGEGFHEKYGGAHAEVNALRDVAEADRKFISRSTLYVSLEPCCFFGKTPPCTNLIIDYHIPKVIISCLDSTPEVAGKGVSQLRDAGVEVVTGVLEEQGLLLSLPRAVCVLERRPYIILKFAQSRNGRFAPSGGQQLWLTNGIAKRLVHKWRSEIDAIMVGTRTARIDNPELTNRLYFGASPLRIVLDRDLTLPPDLKLFDGKNPTLVVTQKAPPEDREMIRYLQLDFDQGLLPGILANLHSRGTGILMVEGGRELLDSFLKAGLWDEARVLVGAGMIEGGIPAPEVPGDPVAVYQLKDNQLMIFQNRRQQVKNSLK